MQTVEQLRATIYKTVLSIEAYKVGVAFSGGVDSSVLAKVCQDIGKDVTLITIGFSSMRDIEISTESSKVLGLDLVHDVLSLKELETGLKKVLATIHFNRIVRLENCTCFYYVFNIASSHRLDETHLYHKTKIIAVQDLKTSNSDR